MPRRNGNASGRPAGRRRRARAPRNGLRSPADVERLWAAVERAVNVADWRGDVYGRVCDECGFAELSNDQALVDEYRRCPRCSS
jgi:predicted Zn-ribbon and HTH transcriptional regulator